MTWFPPVLAYTSSCHRNVVRTPLDNLLPIPQFLSNATLPPLTLNPVTRWEAIPEDWQILAELSHMLSHVALNCHFCEPEDRTATTTPTGLASNGQRGENISAWLAPWEKARHWEQSFPQQRAPFWGNFYTGKVPGYFWSSYANYDSAFVCYFSTSRPSENQQQHTRHADLPLAAAHLCFPLIHPPC